MKRYPKAKRPDEMYYYKDNHEGDIHHFDSLSRAKKEAEKNTGGHLILIFRQGEIVKVIPPKDRT